MNKYQEALELLKGYRIKEDLNIVEKENYNARLEKIIDLLQELVDKYTLENQPNALDKQFAEPLEMLNKLGELK